MISDEVAWEAVVRRDRRMDGRVWFGVTSTGIYCRPSCAARRPRRENVRFFRAVDDAERAGFRACRRCRPGEQTTTLAQRVKALVDDAVEDGITLAELARRSGASAAHLQREFKKAFGVSPREYLAAQRAERLKQRLKEGDDVTTATYEAGYGSSSRVYSQSDARLGMTPSTYRRGGRGMHITFSTTSTSLGRLLVGVTERGVCAVAIGDGDATLERELRDEYPNASIERGDTLAPLVRDVVAAIEGETRALPLDVDATSFQLRVWSALQAIPRGETRTYAEVAAAIGAPSAARAVASACARNKVAVVIPCHRVIRGDGASGGYRWGSERKRRLLERERM
jgi:AraC family transcriptional regulator of adaptative response/methylated-DNA-[protein]-cysteine methyltransferase